MPEGTVVFPGETLLRVTAPLPQAQWVETFLLASLAYPTLVASKAARMRHRRRRPRSVRVRCPARPRAASPVCSRRERPYIAGFDGTSHVEAARLLGIPASGTMAHSWVQSFATEAEAFAAFARVFPGTTTLLVDTYDTLEGVRHGRGDRAADPGHPDRQRRPRAPGAPGPSHPRRARSHRPSRSWPRATSTNTGSHSLLAAGRPIDGFGVGTELITSRDAPGAGAWSTSSSSSTARGSSSSARARRPTRWPSRSIAAAMRQGGSAATWSLGPTSRPKVSRSCVPIVRCRPARGLRCLRSRRSASRCREQLAALPERLLELDARPDYPITYSDVLEADARRLMEQGA